MVKISFSRANFADGKIHRLLFVPPQSGVMEIIMEKTLGMRIADLRRAKGMKQDELAEKLGVSPQAVSKWENDVSCPDIMLLPKLAKELDVTVDELLTGRDESAPAVQLVPEEKRKSFDELMLRIKVDSSDNDRVRVNLPLPLIKVFLDAGMSIEGMGGDKLKNVNIDWNQIMMLIENGVVGKLVEIESSDGDRVEIVVE